MKPIRFHPEAETEFDEAADRYESTTPGLGDAFIVEVDTVIARISEMPLQFPVCPDKPAYRKATLPMTFPFSVFFRERADHTQILAVAHGARLPGYWLRRASR